ncbi:MAG TPA: prepilin peptidase [Aliidongia sp.]|uniref:A24 family peptidase n=1 Tax=Aliidongia sp. TaxID=1914230 RepID=UPI002DDCAA3F|nr:prepilin peptidase [Aliidongia sp.]HEV2676370.1 prepilin peptidase [Aliidongia sp.]
MLSFILAASVLIYLAAVWNDLFHRSIPNSLSLAIAGFAILRLAVSAQIDGIIWTTVTTAIVFAVASFLFARGWLGGGDVKLVSATVLLVGSQGTPPFLLLMAMAGGVLSVLVLMWDFAARSRARRQALTVDAAVSSPPSVPYGVAISFAAICTLFPQLYQH